MGMVIIVGNIMRVELRLVEVGRVGVGARHIAKIIDGDSEWTATTPCSSSWTVTGRGGDARGGGKVRDIYLLSYLLKG
jgi:hypothetical protein